MIRSIPCFIVICMLFPGCNQSASPPVEGTDIPRSLDAKFLPEGDRIFFAVGQDLGAVRDYVASDKFPKPAGVTTYTNIYMLRDESKVFAGLGLDNQLEPVAEDADWWDSGSHNAWKSLQENPQASLLIGLDITEKYAENGLQRIGSGAFDAEIDKLAGFLKKAERPVFLRIGYEFDGAWNQGYEHHQRYVSAWRHIVDRLRAQNVDNAAYVWQASTSPADDAIDGAFEPDLSLWYPGDDYVDWMGYSWFLQIDQHGSNEAAPSTQRMLTDQLLNFARERRKPVMCAEAAPQGYFLELEEQANIGGVIDGPSGENRRKVDAATIWQTWYVPFLQYIYDNADIIRGLAYINCYWDLQPKWGPPYNEGLWGDSRMESNPYITEQMLQEMEKPLWKHGN